MPVAFIYVAETVQLRSRALHCVKQTVAPGILLLARYEIEAPSRRTMGHHDVDVLRDVGWPEVVLRARVAERPLSAFRLAGGGEDGESRAVSEGERLRAFGQVHDASVFRQRPGHDGERLRVLFGPVVLV